MRWRLKSLASRLFTQPFVRRRSKKTSRLRVSGLCVGIHRWPVNSPHKGPVTRKMFAFDDVIMVMSVTYAVVRHGVILIRMVKRFRINIQCLLHPSTLPKPVKEQAVINLYRADSRLTTSLTGWAQTSPVILKPGHNDNFVAPAVPTQFYKWGL